MSRLAGKFALITGGNAGIGLATAQRFIEEGARVAITGRNQTTLAEAATMLGEQCLPVRCDVTSLSDIDALMAKLKDAFGALDIVFANAGILHGASFGATDPAKFEEMFAVNVRGAYFTVERALPLMKAGGSIILNSSVARHIGAAKVAAYAATKGAVHAMAKSMAGELASRGIRVNVVCPGPTDTEMWQSLARVRPGAANVSRQIPLGRIGEAREVANVVTFLASDEASMMTGTELIVDGGRVEASGGAAVFQG
jgi:NAD(P)-dependent dehydrogenase (short-subunit alcohol dehydrogenase family)